jgi:hypothetical protein
MATDTHIREAPRHVVDPELGVNIVDLGLLNAAALLLFMFNTGRSMALREHHGDPI